MKLRQLLETIRKPSTKDKVKHNARKKDGGTLHYVVGDEKDSDKVLGYIDDEYVKKLSKEKGKNISPDEAAKIRLKQVEYFKRNK